MKKIPINICLFFFMICLSSTSYAQEEKSQIIEVEAKYPGGFEQLMKDVADNFRYTEKAQERGVEGTIIVSFKVSDEGEIFDARVVRGLGYGLDEAGLEAVKQLKKFTPARANGRNVKSYFSLPIRCSLDEDTTK